MADIWKDVLGLEQAVGPDQSFFECGGHSLAAMRVIARVQEKMGVEVPVRLLFQAPTLAAFTRAVSEVSRGAGEEVPLRRRERIPTRPKPSGEKDPT